MGFSQITDTDSTSSPLFTGADPGFSWGGGGGGGGRGAKDYVRDAHHERENGSPFHPGSRALDALEGFSCSLVLSEPYF